MRAVLVWACLVGFSCTGGQGSETPPPKPKADLRLFVLTDPKGYLEPCGCQQRPLGGLDRLATLLAGQRADGTPSLLLAAGNLTYGVEIHPEDAEAAQTQERWRAETLIDVWHKLGMTAVTPGPLDFAHGAEPLRTLRERAPFPWLVENVSAQENDPVGLERGRLFAAGPVKVGVFGLIAPTPALKLPEGLSLDQDLEGVAKRASERLRAQGAQLVVALLYGDRRTARQLAAHGPDIIVMGGVDAEEPIPPMVHEKTLLVNAGRQGQRLVTLDLSLSAAGDWHDASRWTLETARRDKKAQAGELKSKIASWEKDPKIDAADLAAQKARLAELERELKSLSTPSYVGRWFTAEAHELGPEVTPETSIAAVLDAHDKRVNEANAKVYVKPVPAPEGAPYYAGSESCKGCHEAAYNWWRNTKHGRAYNTLVERNKQFDLSCVGCHVVGYNQPGGSTVTHVENLKDVGCESCHGPGSQHNAEPEKAGLIARNTPQEVCVGCHNREHSPRFVYDAFRTLLIVPGHGQPLAKTSP